MEPASIAAPTSPSLEDQVDSIRHLTRGEVFFGKLPHSYSKVLCVVLPYLGHPELSAVPQALSDGTPVLLVSSAKITGRTYLSPLRVSWGWDSSPSVQHLGPLLADEAVSWKHVVSAFDKYSSLLFQKHSNIRYIKVHRQQGACCLLIAVVLKGVIPWKEYLLPKELDGVLVKVISGQVHPVSRAARSGLIRGAPTADESGQEGWDIGPGCAIALSSSAEDMRFGTVGFLISVYRDGQLLDSYCTTAGHTMVTIKTAHDEEGAPPAQVMHPCALSTLFFLLQTQCNPTTVRQYMCCVASRSADESEKDVFDLWVREEALADQMPVEHSRIGQLAAATTSDRLPGQWSSMDVGFVKLSLEERTDRLVKTPTNLRKPYTSAALQERNFMQELEIVIDLDSTLRTYRIRNPERLMSNQQMRSLSIGLMRSSLFDMAPIAVNHSHSDAVFNGFALPPHRADPGPAQPGDSGACFYHVDHEGQLRILGMCVSATDMHASDSFTCILSAQDILDYFMAKLFAEYTRA